MSDSEGMSDDEQEARSIRYASLMCIAKLSSGRWAIFKTDPLGGDRFRNSVTYYDQFPADIIIARGEAEAAQRVIWRQEYEERHERLAAGPPTTVQSTQTLEDMGL